MLMLPALLFAIPPYHPVGQIGWMSGDISLVAGEKVSSLRVARTWTLGPVPTSKVSRLAAGHLFHGALNQKLCSQFGQNWVYFSHCNILIGFF